MKRSSAAPITPGPSRQRVSVFEGKISDEYALLTSSLYDFEVYEDPERKGEKGVRSTRALESGEDILLESPLVCWPLNCSVPWTTLSFCENCLKIVAVNPEEASQPEEQCVFCSPRCATVAEKDGWFSILGGHKALWKLRELDWTKTQRGAPGTPHEVYRASSPVTLEAVARVLLKIASNASILKTMTEETKMSPEGLLKLAARPFERLVTPHAPHLGFDAHRASEQLTEILFTPLAQALSCEVAKVLLSPEALSQTWGQLALNAQRLRVWRSDPVTESLCIIEGAGVYTLQSCFNHSCNPNCSVFCFSDATITLTTLRRVAPKEKLTLAYVSSSLPVNERQRLLQENYLFTCDCELCQQQLEA